MTALFLEAMLGQQEALPDGEALVFRAFDRYQAAKSLVGTIETELSHKETKVRLRTDVQFERLRFFYLKQEKTVDGPVDWSNRRRWVSALVICDGRQMSYDHPSPEKRLKGMRACEMARTVDGRPYDLGTIYMVARGVALEESIPLDFLIPGSSTVEAMHRKLQSVRTSGTTSEGAWIVEGQVDDFLTKGPFRMVIDREGNLHTFDFRVDIRTSGWGKEVQETIRFSYRINAQVNAKPDPAKFMIPKA